MKVGNIVKNILVGDKARILEVRDSIFVEDVECNVWDYPVFVKVIYSNGDVEMNPASLYEIISQCEP